MFCPVWAGATTTSLPDSTDPRQVVHFCTYCTATTLNPRLSRTGLQSPDPQLQLRVFPDTAAVPHIGSASYVFRLATGLSGQCIEQQLLRWERGRNISCSNGLGPAPTHVNVW